MRKLILSMAGMVFLGLFVAGCNRPGTGGGTGPGNGGLFKIYGIFVRDANLTSTKDKASFQLTRNDTLFNLAAMTLDTFRIDTTAFITYYRQSPPDFLRPGQSHVLHLVYSPNSLDLTTSLLMPDTFSIAFSGPNIQPDHTDPGGKPVQVNWTGSGNATGYFIAVVNDSAGMDTSFFPIDGSSPEQIPGSAFQIGASTIPGLYKVYVIAFRGGFFPYSGITFSLPPNYTPTDTAYSSTVSGRITAAFVSKFDTIRVTP